MPEFKSLLASLDLIGLRIGLLATKAQHPDTSGIMAELANTLAAVKIDFVALREENRALREQLAIAQSRPNAPAPSLLELERNVANLRLTCAELTAINQQLRERLADRLGLPKQAENADFRQTEQFPPPPV